jgi:hypothetical protein
VQQPAENLMTDRLERAIDEVRKLSAPEQDAIATFILQLERSIEEVRSRPASEQDAIGRGTFSPGSLFEMAGGPRPASRLNRSPSRGSSLTTRPDARRARTRRLPDLWSSNCFIC